MRNIKPELEDWLRPEYKRSDLGELIRGKYAVTQVDFADLTELLLSCIGEDEGIKFLHHSIGNYLANHKSGEWTYEIDNANQITLRYWLDSLENVREELSNPPCVTTAEDKEKLLSALVEGVRQLNAKVVHLT
ncbi:MAG: hypothetical protein AABM67_02130 [Acidobacteriota bacterium]